MSTREEEIKVKVTGADQSERSLDKVGDAAKGVGADVAVMGKESERASKKVDELGDEASQTASQLSRLDRQIAETRVELTKLNDEYERTGDGKTLQSLRAQQAALAKLESTSKRVNALNKQIAADAGKVTTGRVDPLDAIEKRYAALDRESRLRKRMADDEEGARRGRAGRLSRTLGIGESAGQGAFDAIGSVGSSVAGSPVMLGVGAAIAAPAATFIGAAAGGAVGLGAAGAGAGLGLAGAWMGDPVKYGAMWDTTINKLQRRWMDSSKQFGGPLEDSLKVVDRVIRDLPIERIADLSKGFVGPLAEGAGGFVTNLANGFADLLANAQPIVDTVGPELANLGHDVGDALRAIGLGSEGGALALGDLVNVMGYAVKATGVLIMGFENTYKAIRDFEKANFEFVGSVPILGGFLDGLTGSLFNVGSTSMSAGRALHGMGDDAGGAATGVAGLSAALDELRSNELAAADANLALAQGWLDLKTELADGKKTLDLNTQAGIDNQKAILGQVEAAARARQQQIQLTGDVDAANATYAESVERIRAMAYAAGFDKEKVDALIASIAAVPPAKSTTITTPGLGQALDQGISLGNALNNLHDKTVHVTVAVSAPAGISIGNLMHHAAGGTAARSGFAVVGEQGPEIAWLDQGQHISTAQQTRTLLGSAGSSPDIGRGGGSSLSLMVARGADSYVGQLVQRLFDAGMIQVFDGDGQPVTTRRG